MPLTARASAALLAVAGASAAVVVAALPAAAASCAVMRVDYAFSAGRVLELSPPRVRIDAGGCVQFTNDTIGRVSVTVAGGYQRSVDPGETTPVDEAFVGRDAGRRQVTASSGPTSADGTITVTAGPSPSASPSTSPTPSGHRHSARPTQAPSGAAATSPPGSAATPPVSAVGPLVAPPDRPSTSPAQTPPPVVVAPPSATATAAPTPAPAPTSTVVAGRIEPPSGRGAGLPAAVAALAVVGTGAALVRVLAAENDPVDDAPAGGGGA